MVKPVMKAADVGFGVGRHRLEHVLCVLESCRVLQPSGFGCHFAILVQAAALVTLHTSKPDWVMI